MLGITILSLFFLLVIGFGLLYMSLPILRENSIWELLTTSSWKPSKAEFGFLAYIASTIHITIIAIAIALPFSLLTSIYLVEYSAERTKRFFAPIVDVLAGIPPVIYGVWGTITIVPFISSRVAPNFVEFSTGYSVLAGGVVLSIMIIPLLISIFNEVFRSIPIEVREASLALGATKWQTTKRIVLRKSSPGIVAAIMLAVSRAFGETIAVLMVCGNIPIIPSSIFDGCYPLPALIANNYGEMLSIPHYKSALMFAALLLFVIIVFFNAISRLILNRIERRFQI